ncbi:MAG: hypothetical protein JNK10_11405 [Cyclobacteriaceae bacterium]|nr:hypothetical protein [Cyclobacteriaceae bacterium]
MSNTGVSWKYAATVADGKRFEIDKLNIWDNEWIDTGKTIHVKDPLYGKEFTFPVYEIESKNKKVTFAAGEFSNNMWGIYLPR